MKGKKKTLHLDTFSGIDLGIVPQLSGENLMAFIPLSLEIMSLYIDECWKKEQSMEDKILGGNWRSFTTLARLYILMRLQENSRRVVCREEPGKKPSS